MRPSQTAYILFVRHYGGGQADLFLLADTDAEARKACVRWMRDNHYTGEDYTGTLHLREDTWVGRTLSVPGKVVATGIRA
ncbi:hypothetical protein [Embleya sp. NPDC059259]|uniref:hypothetical protein n=1 Tax=unclassified Embleya TaxID=2699296 RepID=UPI0036BC016D